MLPVERSECTGKSLTNPRPRIPNSPWQKRQGLLSHIANIAVLGFASSTRRAYSGLQSERDKRASSPPTRFTIIYLRQIPNWDRVETEKWGWRT
jgi:hypothetical protein